MDAHLASGLPALDLPAPRSVRSPGGRRWRRFRRRRSATWCSWATVDPARPRSPRPCCSPPGRSPAPAGSRTAPPSATSTRRRRSGNISVSLAVAPLEFDGHKINVIDTPGYADFVTDVAAAMRVADLAVFVVSAVEGVEVQTEVAWRMADEIGLPRIVFVNKLDRERASFEQTLEQLKDRFGAGIAPLELPDRRRGRVPRRHRPALRHRRDLRRRLAARQRGSGPRRHGRRGALGARRARRGHRRRRRRPHGALPRRREDRRRPSSATRSRRASTRRRCSRSSAASATKLIGVDRLARFIVEEGPEPHVTGDDGQTALFVFKTIVDPVRRAREPVQGAPGRAAHRRHARERPHRARRAPPPDLDDARQGAGAGQGARTPATSARSPSSRDTTTGDVLAERGTDISVEPFAVPDPLLRDRDPREVEERRGQARDRAAPPRRRGPGAARRPQRRDAPDAARGHGRDARVDRDRAAGAQVRRRRRDRGRAGRRTARRSPARPRPRAR